jgi:hypothetical protein
MIAPVALPRNTILLPGPSMPEDFADKYIIVHGGIAAGHSFTNSDVSDEPAIPPIPPGRGLVSAEVGWSDVQAGLNTGETVKICRDATALGIAVVVAVRCDSPVQQPRCRVIVEISLAPDGLVKEFAKPEKLKAAREC